MDKPIHTKTFVLRILIIFGFKTFTALYTYTNIIKWKKKTCFSIIVLIA